MVKGRMDSRNKERSGVWELGGQGCKGWDMGKGDVSFSRRSFKMPSRLFLFSFGGIESQIVRIVAVESFNSLLS